MIATVSTSSLTYQPDAVRQRLDATIRFLLIDRSSASEPQAHIDNR